MREFFEELGKKLGETADTVSAKAGEVLEVQKIKNQIRTMERSNERDYQDMGKIIYEKYKNGDVIDTALTAICDAVAERENEIANMEKQAAETQGSTVCDACKKYVDKGLSYCPYCGEKMKEAAKDVKEEAKDMANDIKESVKDVAEDIVDAAGEFVEKAKDVTSETMNDIKAKATEMKEETASDVAKEKVEEAADTVKETVEDVAQEASDKTE